MTSVQNHKQPGPFEENDERFRFNLKRLPVFYWSEKKNLQTGQISRNTQNLSAWRKTFGLLHHFQSLRNCRMWQKVSAKRTLIKITPPLFRHQTSVQIFINRRKKIERDKPEHLLSHTFLAASKLRTNGNFFTKESAKCDARTCRSATFHTKHDSWIQKKHEQMSTFRPNSASKG